MTDDIEANLREMQTVLRSSHEPEVGARYWDSDSHRKWFEMNAPLWCEWAVDAIRELRVKIETLEINAYASRQVIDYHSHNGEIAAVVKNALIDDRDDWRRRAALWKRLCRKLYRRNRK